MNEKPYSVVYCHSNVDHLPKKPAVGFFKSLHAALGGEVCSNNIKAIYVVSKTETKQTNKQTKQCNATRHGTTETEREPFLVLCLELTLNAVCPLYLFFFCVGWCILYAQVHPSPLLRTWILSFQIRVDPHLFKKVVYVHSLRELDASMHGHDQGKASAFAEELPPHVHEFERNRNK